MKQTLIILGRFPKVGNVKTRLAKDIGEKKAVLFYKNCAENIFLEIEKLDNTKLFFYYADFKNKLEIKNWVGKKFECIDPKFSDIEKNLHYAFSNCFKLGFEKVVSVATDVPQLSTKIIDQAFKALDKNDVVIGPDNDGGFYLFGVKKFYPNLFNFKYLDKSKMVSEEIERVKNYQLSYFVLQQLIDVDTIKDLDLLTGDELI